MSEEQLQDIKTWPPGSVMVYKSSRFNGVGVVISNDGVGTIAVVWGSNCNQQFCVYRVNSLNQVVLSKLDDT